MGNITHKIKQQILDAEAVIIGCSAGGLSLLSDLIVQLSPGMPFGIIVVIHRSGKFESSIEKVLTSKGHIQVNITADKQSFKRGNVYFAPADYHLLLEPDRSFTLDFSEPVHFCRPSIDVTCMSVSDVLGARVIGILLSGANKDGAAGMKYIGDNGGLVVVQDPRVAEVGIMPAAAIREGSVDMVLKNEEIFNLLNEIYRIKGINN